MLSIIVMRQFVSMGVNVTDVYQKTKIDKNSQKDHSDNGRDDS